MERVFPLTKEQESSIEKHLGYATKSGKYKFTSSFEKYLKGIGAWGRRTLVYDNPLGMDLVPEYTKWEINYGKREVIATFDWPNWGD